MLEIVYSQNAEQDLEEIGDFIARDSISCALEYLEKMQKSIELIASNPNIGLSCKSKNIDIECRLFIFDDYLIFYKVLEDEIIIIRVLHGSVNYKKILV